ncbi:uncharacterized protein LOC122370086 [Amphibalanus amphitrite]|uniref:uncharacterized protein LOC122370086 n=1 Tax=Amphibalanus amphitrite TaxID=1232801 RepID=UPI001C908B46|nr:uncharacterized protein LOC122370086 [Amphibalanus amphitrite]
MGSGQSRDGGGGALHLAGSGLTFSPRQLRRLNDRFAWMEHSCNAALNSYYSAMQPRGGGPGLAQLDAVGTVEAAVERLVQRIVATVGARDPRFAACFLLSVGSSYEHYKVNEPDEYDYMVRLDSLSWPPLYPGDDAEPPCELLEDQRCPQGFGRLRLAERHRDTWAEFVDGNGLLMRERLRDRFLALVREAVANPITNMRDVQEASLCGCSGKIVDIGVLEYILRLPPEQRFFLAIGDPRSDLFPDPSQLDIAVTCDGPSVKLDVQFPAGSCCGGGGALPGRVSIDLTLAVGLTGWPTRADFPDRVPLSSVDALVVHRAASKGFYMVPTEPHPSHPCAGRSTVWRVSMSAAEMELSTHYSHDSAPAAVLRVLKIISSQLSEPDTILSRQLPPTQVKDLLSCVSTYMLKTLFYFELESDPELSNWGLGSVSRHVLRILDALEQALRYKNLRSYFFPGHNVILRKDCRPSEYTVDATVLERFLRTLHSASSAGDRLVRQLPERRWLRIHRRRVRQEERLLAVWLKLLERQQRHLPAGQFSQQQVEYLDELLRQVAQSGGRSEKLADGEKDLSSVVLLSLTVAAHQLFPSGRLGDSLTQQSRGLGPAVQLAAATAAAAADEPAGRTLVRALRVLGAQTESGRSTGRLLARLYTAAALNGALLGEDRDRRDLTQLRQMAQFAAAVCGQMGSASAELEERSRSGQLWAQQLLELSERLGCVRLVFTPERGRTISCLVRPGGKSPPPLRPRVELEKDLEFLLQEAEMEDSSAPPARTVHCMLQFANPIRSHVDHLRRYGRQRGLGHIVPAIIRMGQGELLERLADGLPPPERSLALHQLQQCLSAMVPGGRPATNSQTSRDKGALRSDRTADRNGALPSGAAHQPSWTAEPGQSATDRGRGATDDRLELRDAVDAPSGTLGRGNPAFCSGDERDTEAEWVMIVHPPAKVAERPANAQFSTKL